MRVGVIVEGQSEYKALPAIVGEICDATEATAVKILHATYDPFANPGRIVRACESRIKQLAGRNYDLAVVLVDRETRTESCQAIASDLEQEFRRKSIEFPISVVVKDRCFENWLIADIQALRQLRARFDVSDGLKRRVQPNRADGAEALRLLKQAAKGDAYGKVDDAARILEKASLGGIAAHSRSFRCFLGRLGHADYANGSCAPA